MTESTPIMLRSRPVVLVVSDAPETPPFVPALDGLGDTHVVRPADAVPFVAARDVDVLVFEERTEAARLRALRAEVLALRPTAVVILIADGPAAAGDADATVLPPPVSPATLRAVCAMALRCATSARQVRRLRGENARLRGPAVDLPLDDLGHVERYEGVLTRSPAMARVLAFLQRAEGGDAPLVIQGEPGVGKTCIAEAIHARSRRRHGPFVVASFGGVGERARESLLLGHRAGAGPDGPGAADGRLVEADGGTLFVDDIADASPALQLALLRVLDDGTFLPLGADRPRRVNVRVLSGTQRSLDELVRQGVFRRDLAERMRVATLSLPPLRDRTEDVFLLARQFLATASAAIGRKPPGLSREARMALESYAWPGNVRELRNVMERAAIVCRGGLVIAADLPLGWTRPAAEADGATPSCAIAIPPGGASLKQLEREIFVKTLALAGGNQSRAAHILGLCESTFRFRLHKLGIASRRTPAKGTQPVAPAPMVARA